MPIPPITDGQSESDYPSRRKPNFRNLLERYLATAQSAASRAAALTHRLLAFSRRQTLDPRPTNPNKLIGDMAELVQRTVGPHIKVETVFGIGVWPILC